MPPSPVGGGSGGGRGRPPNSMFSLSPWTGGGFPRVCVCFPLDWTPGCEARLLALPVSTPLVFSRFTTKPLSQWFAFVLEARLGTGVPRLWLSSGDVFGCHLSACRCRRPAERLGGGAGPEASHLCTPASSEALPSGPGCLDGPNSNSSIQPCEVSSKPLGLICRPRPGSSLSSSVHPRPPCGPAGLAPAFGFPGLWGLASPVSGVLAAPCTFKPIPKRFFLNFALPVGAGRSTVPL